MTKPEIVQLIVKKIHAQIGISLDPTDYDKNLFEQCYDILPRDMLQIIIELESDVGYKVTDIFKTNDCSIMTINTLSELIFNLGNNRLDNKNAF